MGRAAFKMAARSTWNSRMAFRGDPKLWKQVPAFLHAETIRIIDSIHVTQCVWKAAKVFCESPDDISDFARERVLWLLQGRVSSVM